MAVYQVIAGYDPDKPIDKQKVTWETTTDGEYEGWTVFPAEYRARPESDDDATALIVNGEIIGVQRSLAADIASKAAADQAAATSQEG